MAALRGRLLPMRRSNDAEVRAMNDDSLAALLGVLTAVSLATLGA